MDHLNLLSLWWNTHLKCKLPDSKKLHIQGGAKGWPHYIYSDYYIIFENYFGKYCPTLMQIGTILIIFYRFEYCSYIYQRSLPTKNKCSKRNKLRTVKLSDNLHYSTSHTYAANGMFPLFWRLNNQSLPILFFYKINIWFLCLYYWHYEKKIKFHYLIFRVCLFEFVCSFETPCTICIYWYCFDTNSTRIYEQNQLKSIYKHLYRYKHLIHICAHDSHMCANSR